MWPYHILQDLGDRLDDLFNNFKSFNAPPQQIRSSIPENGISFAFGGPKPVGRNIVTQAHAE